MGFLSAFNKKPATERQLLIERLARRIAACLQYIDSVNASLKERTLTLIARSPSSEIARALALQAENLEQKEISARMIFAKLAPIEMAAEMASALNLTSSDDSGKSSVRIIKTPALLNAHEQLVIGDFCCWTGDMLRRNEGNRNGLDLWEDNSAGASRLAQFAFNAIWPAAKPVPARALRNARRVAKDSDLMASSIVAAELASNMAVKRNPRLPYTHH